MIIRFSDIQCHANHGVLDAEKQNGNTFRVGVSIRLDTPLGVETDDIHDTLDYRGVCDIVKREMQISSDLIEHVAWRIKQALQEQYPEANEVVVRVAKKSPPMSLPVDWVEVEV